jgi:hypothetical protein
VEAQTREFASIAIHPRKFACKNSVLGPTSCNAFRKGGLNAHPQATHLYASGLSGL